jgi:hypothetical protein
MKMGRTPASGFSEHILKISLSASRLVSIYRLGTTGRKQSEAET